MSDKIEGVSQTKRYIGDGVYAEVTVSHDVIRLTTSDGISDTNEIFLDPDIFVALVQFVREAWPTLARVVESDEG
ncbi:MAG TPA: hypothetical protein VFO16_01610 [Pseudonocardiaceae bacterium]|nr:hypothetical protein [Pseudonocardiaceae bacterium]